MKENVTVYEAEHRTPQQLAKPSQRAADLMEMMRAVIQKGGDIVVMEKIFAMNRELVMDERKQVFADALHELQSEIPPIRKKSIIPKRGGVGVRSKYAKLEDIDVIVRPLLKKWGFSVTYDSAAKNIKEHLVSCTLKHREGHEDTKSILLPLDQQEFRTDVQSVASTISFAKRTLLKMHLNITEYDEDNDGTGGDGGFITEDQARDLHTLAVDIGANEKRFFKLYAIDSWDKLPARLHQAAIEALEDRRRAIAEAKQKESQK